MRKVLTILFNITIHALLFVTVALISYYLIIWFFPPEIVVDGETHPVMAIAQVLYAISITFILNVIIVIARNIYRKKKQLILAAVMCLTART